MKKLLGGFALAALMLFLVLVFLFRPESADVVVVGGGAAGISAAIEAAVSPCGLPLRHCADMEEAVRWLAGQAVAGDCVLLSPACASLDMYRNYAQRAEAFIAAVNGLSS